VSRLVVKSGRSERRSDSPADQARKTATARVKTARTKPMRTVPVGRSKTWEKRERSTLRKVMRARIAPFVMSIRPWTSRERKIPATVRAMRL
jgi:hypothetical protein